MEQNRAHSEEDLASLKQEIENFKKDRERIKGIVGQIGGIPSINTKLLNILFVIFVCGCFLISLRSGGVVQLAMIELAIAAVSLKLILLMHYQSRVNHFQLWILSSLEWRVNEVIKILKEK